ncbi:secreted protein [Candidatus Omnitrophus magneticus]|uniref:Secreted protein n=1 Tax=Candidatus Omnitrophus magneticus TaxID=1609969 RepID=A0A0F0CQE5_9BACT|nr:secreted protein [Candidatus Omnitrophus magneticus]
MKKIIFIAAIVLYGTLAAFSVSAIAAEPDSVNRVNLTRVENWFILLNYDVEKFPFMEEKFNKYDMAVLDPDVCPDFKNYTDKKIFIAYVSFGEAESYRPYWGKIKDKEWVLRENPDWKENYYIDPRSYEWEKIIINEIIPDILKKGFNGIMLDTIDTAGMLESENIQKFYGAKRAMIDLVRAVRLKYPDLIMLSNNGFEILEDIAPFIDGLIVEDINMMPDFKNGGYKKVESSEREYKISVLRGLMDRFKLNVFAIDYAPCNSRQIIKDCVTKCRKLGFNPYVAEKDLNAVYDNRVNTSSAHKIKSARKKEYRYC